MQTPDQSRETQSKQQNWKVVAGVAAVTALGFSGLALATPDRAQQSTPPAIELDDRRATSELNTPIETRGDWEVVNSPSFTPDLDDSLGSPLASADLDSPDDSPDAQSSSAVEDSPDADDSPDAQVAPSSDDSPDDSPDAQVAPSSDDSPDDSPVDSPDDSADDSVDGSDD